MTAFARQLATHTTRYVQLRRALGHSFDTQAATLRAFQRFVEERAEAGPLTQQLVLAFVLQCPVTPRVRARRYGVLRQFADYYAVFDPRTDVLDPRALPRARAIPPVRILDETELAQLLRAAQDLSPRHPIRGQTVYTIIGLLASTGLRSGEVVRLDRQDVDLDRGILHVRRTKFRKTRLVPVHSTTLEKLQTYATARDTAYPRSASAAFFLSRRGGRLSASGFREAFHQARVKAGLDAHPHGAVRPHDLRHRFAVTRLVSWYRDGTNVQAALPLLATYLGHARYSDTAYYITGTPDLLGLAADRAFGRDGGAS